MRDHRRRLILFSLTLVPFFVTLASTTVRALPVVTIDDVRLKEGMSSSQTMTFKVHLTPPPDAPVTVEYATEDGTATTTGGDYDAISGVIEFPAGASVMTVHVTCHGDVLLEGNEWFRVRLLNPVGATIGDAEAIGMLTNDEGTNFTVIPGQSAPYLAGTLPNAWGDYDNDGVPDLPLYDVQPNGELIEVPGFRGLLDNGNYHGVSWCDYDRDGDVDLVLLGYSGIEGGVPTPSRLLRNDGAAGFIDVAPVHGIDIVGSGETPVWADFDGDGWPDLFAPYYSHIHPFQSFLYRNNGDGTFTERASDAGVSLPGIPPELRPEGAHAADWNDDGYLDLFCASHLFVNDGTGVFTDVRASVGLPILFDEGAAFADIDQDGDLDLFLRGLLGPRLFRNDAGQFVETTSAAGLVPLPTLWGDSWADADGDGDLDLLLQSGDGTTRLMLNQGDGTFERDLAFEEIAAWPDLSAWADIDDDGDADLVLGSGPTRRLYRNHLDQHTGFPGSHLTVRVLDTTGHRTVHGATVRLHTLGGPPGTTQTRVIDSGSGYLGQNEYDVRFGGLGAGRYALEVVYPSPAGSRVVVDSLVNLLLGGLEPSTMIEDKVTIYRDGVVELSGETATAGARSSSTPASNYLGSPTPTPSRGPILLPIHVTSAGRASLAIHDLRGRLLRRFALPATPASTVVTWDLIDMRGTRVPPGVYFCRLLVDERPVDVRRLVIMR